jgi:hypothetical protein
MNGGQILGALWMLAFWFFIVSVFVLPVVFSYWRHNERLRAEQTEKTLESLGYDTTHRFEQDAL